MPPKAERYAPEAERYASKEGDDRDDRSDRDEVGCRQTKGLNRAVGGRVFGKKAR